MISDVTCYNACILHYDMYDALHNLLRNKMYIISMNGAHRPLCRELWSFAGQSGGVVEIVVKWR